jgi:hypothetical protein
LGRCFDKVGIQEYSTRLGRALDQFNAFDLLSDQNLPFDHPVQGPAVQKLLGFLWHVPGWHHGSVACRRPRGAPILEVLKGLNADTQFDQMQTAHDLFDRGNNGQDQAFNNLIANPCFQFGDDTVVGGLQAVFHFHGFQYDERLTA